MGNAVSQLINNATTTISGALDDSQTDIVVSASDLFPLDGDFYIRINTETMLVTAVSGTTFTVTRGVEGTNAIAHSDSSSVRALTTASTLENYFQEQWVHGHSNLPKMSITDPNTGLRAVVADFDWVNQGTAVATDRGTNIILEVPTAFSSNNQLRGLFIDAPSPPYAITGAFNFHTETGGAGLGTNPWPQAGLSFYETSTTKLFNIMKLPRSDAPGDQNSIQIATLSNPTTFLGSKVHVWWNMGSGPIWFKIEDNNTNLVFYTGINGIDWIQLYSEGRTAHMSGGPNQIGFHNNQAGNNDHIALLEMLHFGLE